MSHADVKAEEGGRGGEGGGGEEEEEQEEKERWAVVVFVHSLGIFSAIKCQRCYC